MRIQALICDFDGVLLDSAEVKTRAFARLFEPICPERVPAIIAYHEATMGYSRYVKFRHIYAQILQRPLSAEQEHNLGERFSRLVVSQLLDAPLVDGVRAFLDGLWASRPYLLFVASGTPTDELCRVAKAKSLFDDFREWHGSPRTKPEIIRDLLARYQIKTEEAVFIGDAMSDCLAAEETGTAFIGRVTEPDSPLQRCRYRIQDFYELPERLAQLRVDQQMKEGAS